VISAKVVGDHVLTLVDTQSNNKQLGMQDAISRVFKHSLNLGGKQRYITSLRKINVEENGEISVKEIKTIGSNIPFDFLWLYNNTVIGLCFEDAILQFANLGDGRKEWQIVDLTDQECSSIIEQI